MKNLFSVLAILIAVGSLSAADRLNLLVITVDDLSAASIGAFGCQRRSAGSRQAILSDHEHPGPAYAALRRGSRRRDDSRYTQPLARLHAGGSADPRLSLRRARRAQGALALLLVGAAGRRFRRRDTGSTKSIRTGGPDGRDVPFRSRHAAAVRQDPALPSQHAHAVDCSLARRHEARRRGRPA